MALNIFGASDNQKLTAVQNRLAGQAGILGTNAGGYKSQTTGGCTSSADCPEGQECLDGKCEEIRSCTSDADCPSGYECKNGKCSKKTTTTWNQCKKCNKDTGEIEKFSIQATCDSMGGVPLDAPDPPCQQTGPCTSSADCPTGYKCDHGMCIVAQGCRDDTECPKGYKCENRECVIAEGGQGCLKDTDCPAGQTCVNGKCEPKGPCTKDSDCPTGQKCVSGKCVPTTPGCTKDTDCPTGQTCVNGVCQPATTAACGKGAVGTVTTACPCGDGFYRTKEADACPSGYRTMGAGADARCECDSYVPPGDGGGAGCTNNGDCPAGQTCINGRCETPGEFKWSSGTSALMKRLQERANWLLDNPGGMTAEERAAIQNRSFEAIKAQERPELKATQDRLARMGLLGTGFQNVAEAGVRRGTAANLAGTQRDLAIEEQKTKVDDMIKTTGLAQAITGEGISSEQIVEAINAARRGEGRADQSLLLQYLSMLFGNQNSAYQAYWHALLAQIA